MIGKVNIIILIYHKYRELASEKLSGYAGNIQNRIQLLFTEHLISTGQFATCWHLCYLSVLVHNNPVEWVVLLALS